MLIRPQFFPDMPMEDDWEPLIRKAIADADNPRHVTIHHPGGTLQLDACTRVGEDGKWSIPLWDDPREGVDGKVTSIRLDGDKKVITLEDGHSWGELVEKLDAHLSGWDSEVMLALSELVHIEEEVVKAEKRLTTLKNQRRRVAQEAHRLGVTKYRMAEVTGRTEATVARWVRS